MSVKALQEYTRIAKYAKYLPEKRRRETWGEQVDRVFDMHERKYTGLGIDTNSISEEVNFAKGMMMQKRILGSQRALQFGGDPILKHEARIYNCAVSYCDRPRFFQEYMYMLLCGCGVGFSVQKHHIAKLPQITWQRLYDTLTGQVARKTFVVPDSIEGWADAIGVLLSSYFTKDQSFPEYYSYEVDFDYSQIRPEGALLSSGYKAPGAKGLARTIEKIRAILNSAGNFDFMGLTARPDSARLKPIEAYDILMHAADAIISGGVRRSATISLFTVDDEEMAKAKTGDWFVKNPQRGRSNNSAVLLRGSTTPEQFHQLMEWTREFGEPGFIWVDSLEALLNPCAEIMFWAYLSVHGTSISDVVSAPELLSGWSCCNLCEINGKLCKTPEDFYQACRAASILGTLQAGYTKFPYLGSVSEQIVIREALLGVSITGMMDSPDVLFDSDVLQKGAQIVKDTNRKLAVKIGINPAARTTCVKPAGSSSCVLGTASGIHPHHARRYFRRIQANRQEVPAQYYKVFNPRAVEQSVWDPNKVTEVITFLCEVPEGARTKNQVNAISMLEQVKSVQQNWVVPGTNLDLCTQPWLRHNVSNTITVKPEEWEGVESFIYSNREWFTGISLIPSSGDKDYPQAPFCAVPYPQEMVKLYGPAALFASGVVEGALAVFDNNLWAACDTLLGNGKAPLDTQMEWLAKATQFAERHFKGDVRQMTYCLKDSHNLHLWANLSREQSDVDWQYCEEDMFDQAFEQDGACQGGACDAPDYPVPPL